MTGPAVRMPASKPDEFVAFVTLATDPGEVRVRRARHGNGIRWKCDACGPHRVPTCPHEKAAHEAPPSLREETDQCD